MCRDCNQKPSRSAWIQKVVPLTTSLLKGCGGRVKYEEIYLKDYESPRTARESLTQYMGFYNNERPHQALGYRTPREVYFGQRSS
jgi:transposase InsO family protein